MEPAENKKHPGYETTDATPRSVLLLVAFTLGLAAVGVVSMYFLYSAVIGYHAARDQDPSPLAHERAGFTGPRLQVAPPRELKEMKAAEQAVLDSTAWIDREAGIVRIPIARAIDLLAERGLPVRQTPPRPAERSDSP